MLTATKPPADDAETIAANLRRLMARDGLTFVDVIQATGLDERTVRGVARATNRPHARTLHRLAQGLGVCVDELFLPAGVTARRFDRETNREIDGIIRNDRELFFDWSEADFDELYSQFGTGGPLSGAGVRAAAEAINAKRALVEQVGVILESGEAELLADFVRLLYERVAITSDAPAANREDV